MKICIDLWRIELATPKRYKHFGPLEQGAWRELNSLAAIFGYDPPCLSQIEAGEVESKLRVYEPEFGQLGPPDFFHARQTVALAQALERAVPYLDNDDLMNAIGISLFEVGFAFGPMRFQSHKDFVLKLLTFLRGGAFCLTSHT